MKSLLLVSLFTLLSSQAIAANPKITIKTNKGDLEAELFEDKAPVTVKNFLTLILTRLSLLMKVLQE